MTDALRHVAYVDDALDMRMLVQAALGNEGIRVTVCANGIELLETILDNPPQMILLDVMMREMDGPSIFEEIKKHRQLSGTPVVFITSQTSKAEVDSYFAQGAAGFIAKPFDMTTLAAQIRDIWNHKKG